MDKPYLTSEISIERNKLRLRGSILITAVFLISLLETFLSIYLDLRQVPYIDYFHIAVFVIFITLMLISVTYFKKNLLVWHEWSIFGIYLLFFFTIFCVWVYRLEDLRLLALINALTSITILLSYASIRQSILISAAALVCYLSATWYSISIVAQPGSLTREFFFALCLIPSFILISVTASYINKNRERLRNANERLINEQMLTEIEMNLASEIQNVIFPLCAPEISDWEIAFCTKPYGAVSGDFYDFYTSDNSLNGISLFDVSGHGVAPALITILAKPVLYSHFNHLKSQKLGTVLNSVNSDLHKELDSVSLYITGIMLRMNGHDVEYANAGHPDLIHYKKSENKVSIITDSSCSFKGLPIGLSRSTGMYASHEFKISSGDFIIIYSDGFTESRNPAGEQFGLTRLTEAIESSVYNDAAGMLEHIMNCLNSFIMNVKAGDDITLIIAAKI